jgi:hypothetical protein
MKFSKVNWKSVYKWLREKQSSLVEAYKKAMFRRFDTFKYQFWKILEQFQFKKRSEVSWVKKQSYKSTSRIIIKPSNDNFQKFKNKVWDIIGSHTDLSTLVLKLNEYLRGCAIYNYYNW